MGSERIVIVDRTRFTFMIDIPDMTMSVSYADSREESLLGVRWRKLQVQSGPHG